MSDLISRKALINSLEDENSQYEVIIDIPKNATTKDIIEITLTEYRKLMFQAINNQPTAYDVDKVVEKLENEKGDELDYVNQDGKRLVRHWNLCVDNCKQVVKGAVKDE